MLRDQSARRTIGGGTVLDVLPPNRGRARPGRLAYLNAMRGPDHGAAIEAAIEAAQGAVSLDKFARARNLDDRTADAVFAATDMIALGAGAGRVGLSAARWAALGASLRAALADWHARTPDAVGPTEANVRAALEPRLPSEVLALAIPRLEADGVVVREGARLRLPEHRPRMTAQDEALWLRLAPRLDEAGVRPPLIRELAEARRPSRAGSKPFWPAPPGWAWWSARPGTATICHGVLRSWPSARKTPRPRRRMAWSPRFLPGSRRDRPQPGDRGAGIFRPGPLHPP